MILIVGEKRSKLAIRKGLRWRDGGLAAKPLFAALHACGIDPLTCEFTNWFERGGSRIVRAHVGPVIGLGNKVQTALKKAKIAHIPLVHPAARGAIRRRDRYIAHVGEQLQKLI